MDTWVTLTTPPTIGVMFRELRKGVDALLRDRLGRPQVVGEMASFLVGWWRQTIPFGVRCVNDRVGNVKNVKNVQKFKMVKNVKNVQNVQNV